MRVYEIAKDLGASNKELLDLLHKKGFIVQSHMAALSQEQIDFIYASFGRKDQLIQKDEQRAVHETKKEEVILKEAVAKQPQKLDEKKHSAKTSEKELNMTEPQQLPLRQMTIAEFAQLTKKPVNEVILYLLRQKSPYAINQLLPIKVVEQLAQHYDIEIVRQVQKQDNEQPAIVKKNKGESRLPIVVVIGHVDHGKTTLLDYIRKTRVAAKEKGGITQHLGAYQVSTSHGSLVFLDTPGHEAFTKMRSRGIKLADIAILVVAADDGVMPQTIEAIKHAQIAQIPIIVAINKVDKASPAQVEKVKQELVRYNLLPEQWGGDTICVPVSAKLGEGVDQLLEMVALQAELMELKGDLNSDAKGFVLEAKIEKGRGPVAIVILHQGTMRLGDYFTAGVTHGKINSIVDSYGALLKETGPSVPVKISGLEKLPEAGDVFQVIPEIVYRKIRSEKAVLAEREQKAVYSADAINLIIKGDNKSSCEALTDAVKRIGHGADKEMNLVYVGVGDITESDISLAENTNSLIYGFHVKMESNAVSYAQQQGIEVKLFDVIYHLLEDIERIITIPKEPKKERVKTGQAEVRKVFAIKGVGVIAGSYVKDGRILRAAEVEIFRNNQKIGQGSVKSLERDRKAVKEVHKGFECAFLIDNFNDWQEGDRVDFYILKPSV